MAPPGARDSKSARTRASRHRRNRILQIVGLGVVVVALTGIFVIGNGGAMNTSLHQHPHIEITIQGTAVTVPTDIGIGPSLWKDHSMDEYRQMETMSPIHTHDSSGTIHLEMGKWHPCTLGDFFDVWGQPFDSAGVLSYPGAISLTVDGKPSAEYRDLVLQDGQQIVIRGG